MYAMPRSGLGAAPMFLGVALRGIMAESSEIRFTAL
jgi:hypothetical protein